MQCKVCDCRMSAKKSVLQKHARSKKHIEAINAEYCRNVGDGDSSTRLDSVKLLIIADPHLSSFIFPIPLFRLDEFYCEFSFDLFYSEVSSPNESRLPETEEEPPLTCPHCHKGFYNPNQLKVQYSSRHAPFPSSKIIPSFLFHYFSFTFKRHINQIDAVFVV